VDEKGPSSSGAIVDRLQETDMGDQRVGDLIAMFACFASLLPLGRIFLGMKFFSHWRMLLQELLLFRKILSQFSTINGVLMWLYLR